MKSIPFAALSVAAAMALAGAPLAMADAPNANSTPAPVNVPSSGNLVQEWLQEQRSSASTLEKVLYTAELYGELPLVTQQSRQLILPDFLMVQGTPSQAYADGRMRTFFASWTSLGDAWINDFTYQPTILSCTIQDDKATVTLIPNAVEHMCAAPSVEAHFPAVTHTLTLEMNPQGFWVIADDEYDDEFKDAYGDHVDWTNLIQSIPYQVARLKSEPITTPPEHPTVTNVVVAPGSRPQISTNMPYYISYNRSAAANYALTYTNNSGDSISTQNYNPLFYAYSGNDCADYVSQCLWAGFGGSNSSYGIQAHAYPMITASEGAVYPWYADSAPDGSAMWINAYSLINDAKSNYNNSYYGVQMYVESVSSVALGDVVLDSSGAGHVEIVTSLGSTPSWSNICISSHTNNRYNVPLSQLYSPSQYTNVTFYRVSAYLHPPMN